MNNSSELESKLLTVTTIGLDLALSAMQAALSKAKELSVSVSFVIVGASGHQICSAHMDKAPIQCRDIALRKAQTAAGFMVSTRDWEHRLEGMSKSVQQGLPLQSGLVLFGGGEPFIKDGVAVGAIGVSGSTEEIDQACALAAVSAISDLIS